MEVGGGQWVRVGVGESVWMWVRGEERVQGEERVFC